MVWANKLKLRIGGQSLFHSVKFRINYLIEVINKLSRNDKVNHNYWPIPAAEAGSAMFNMKILKFWIEGWNYYDTIVGVTVTNKYPTKISTGMQMFTQEYKYDFGIFN